MKGGTVKRYVRWLAVILPCMLASTALASPASDVLFRGAKMSLGLKDREEIARQVGLKLSKDGKHFVDDQGKQLTIEVRELKLNADKTPEVLVIIGGSAALFGLAGSGVQLYVKDRRSRYVQNLGFPAADVKVLPTRTKGYQDLQILGPGFQCPVWRWNGTMYDFSHTVKC